MTDFQQQRKTMVETQLLTNKVTVPAVLDAFSETPREKFVPLSHEKAAYLDEDIALGQGRYLIEPMVLARLIQAAEISADDRVADFAANTGYATFIFSKLAKEVKAFETDSSLIEIGKKAFEALSVSNASLTHSLEPDRLLQQGPFNVIFINGSVPFVDPVFFEALAEEGRLIALQRTENSPLGQAVLYRKVQGSFEKEVLFDAFVPLLPFVKEQELFSF